MMKKLMMMSVTILVSFMNATLLNTTLLNESMVQSQYTGPPGSDMDINGCLGSAGYTWCEPMNKCLRPWITPCHVKTEYCPESPMQLCRMMCPPVHCSEGECAMRKGRCCSVSCVKSKLKPVKSPEDPPLLKLGDVCKSGGVETGKGVHRMNDCPSGSKCLSSNQMAIGGESPWVCQEHNELSNKDELKNCKTWYDGCNHCFVKHGETVACTEKYCLQKGKEKCLVYNDNH